jgi:hypothetical protein
MNSLSVPTYIMNNNENGWELLRGLSALNSFSCCQGEETIDFDGLREQDINYTIKHSTRQLYANINSSDPLEVPTSL